MSLQKYFYTLTLVLGIFSIATAQVPSGVYMSTADGVTYELKISDNYLVMSSYKTEPAEFLQTMGGFYEIEEETIKVDLEFNSDYEKDSVSHVDMPYKANAGMLIIDLGSKMVFQQRESTSQELDGQWLFATRGPDTGQDRRGESNARKTLKFLMDGRFQWIAYHTETMKFSGSGGGSFSSVDGKYVESIEYFSKDNTRVGAELGFDYEVKGKDWHHTGKNSRGEPMYEIWGRR